MTGSRIEYSQRTQARDYARDDEAQFMDAIREREDALAFEATPYNAFAAADQERHYLYRAGYTSYCDCSGCEGAREAQYAEEAEVYYFDFEATVEEIDQMAADLFDRAEADRAREFEPDPWAGATSDPWAGIF